jgi:hypothetical protein
MSHDTCNHARPAKAHDSLRIAHGLALVFYGTVHLERRRINARAQFVEEGVN